MIIDRSRIFKNAWASYKIKKRHTASYPNVTFREELVRSFKYTRIVNNDT